MSEVKSLYRHLEIDKNTIIVGRPGEGKTSLVIELFKKKIINEERKIIWLTGSSQPKLENELKKYVFVYKKINDIKHLDNLLKALEVQLSEEEYKYCFIFDDLQMLLPSSKQYCSLLANGRHYNTFCITLFQSLEFYTRNWKMINDNTFNWVIFNIGQFSKTVSRVLCGNTTKDTIENNWKMKAYRKCIKRNHGNIFYANTAEQLLLTGLTGSIAIIFEAWRIMPSHLRERVAIKTSSRGYYILDLKDTKKLLEQENSKSIYNLCDIKRLFYSDNGEKDTSNTNPEDRTGPEERLDYTHEPTIERDDL